MTNREASASAAADGAAPRLAPESATDSGVLARTGMAAAGSVTPAGIHPAIDAAQVAGAGPHPRSAADASGAAPSPSSGTADTCNSAADRDAMAYMPGSTTVASALPDDHRGAISPRTARANWGTATHQSNTAPAHCANCGAAVSGPYCSQCGQRVEHAAHSVWHFACEMAEDLTHADSRLWRTLIALLFKPGFLTREFFAGRRVSYLPPLRLYLVLSVFFFLIAATVTPISSVRFVAVDRDDLRAPRELARQAAAIAAQGTRERTAQSCAKLRYTGPWQSRIEPAFRTSCQRIAEDDGHALGEAFFHNLPRAIFLAAPVLALVMVPLYLRPRRFYVEHLLFVLHDHAFVFALLALYSIVAAALRVVHVPVGALGLAVGCYIPCYYYLALRRVYGQSPARTLGKFAVLALAYLITGALVLLATGLYSVLSQ